MPHFVKRASFLGSVIALGVIICALPAEAAVRTSAAWDSARWTQCTDQSQCIVNGNEFSLCQDVTFEGGESGNGAITPTTKRVCTRCDAPGTTLECPSSTHQCNASSGRCVLKAAVNSAANTPSSVTPVAQPGQQSSSASTNSNSSANSSGGTLVNPLKATSIPGLLTIVLRGLVQIGSIILVLMLVWVGFMFVLAQGNEEKVKSARQALMWTVVGGLVLLGATAIAELIEATVTAL